MQSQGLLKKLRLMSEKADARKKAAWSSDSKPISVDALLPTHLITDTSQGQGLAGGQEFRPLSPVIHDDIPPPDSELQIQVHTGELSAGSKGRDEEKKSIKRKATDQAAPGSDFLTIPVPSAPFKHPKQVSKYAGMKIGELFTNPLAIKAVDALLDYHLATRAEIDAGSRYKQEVEKLKRDIRKLKADHTERESNLKNRSQVLESEITLLKSRNDFLAKKGEDRRTQLNDATKRIDDLEVVVSDNNTSIRQRDERIASFEDEVKGLRQELADEW